MTATIHPFTSPQLRAPATRTESEARAEAAARFQPLLDVLAQVMPGEAPTREDGEAGPYAANSKANPSPSSPALHPTFAAALAPWRPAS